MSDETRSDDEILQAWQEAITGALARREDIIMGTEGFLTLLMLSYRYARASYEDAGTPHGKSAAAVMQWLLDRGAIMYDERDPWPRDPDGPIVGITVIPWGDYKEEVH